MKHTVNGMVNPKTPQEELTRYRTQIEAMKRSKVSPCGLKKGTPEWQESLARAIAWVDRFEQKIKSRRGE